jgi:two-component system, NarL family, response regulator DegU
LGGIKILIADDHMLIREGLRKVLSLSKEIDVIGEACDGLDAVTKADQLKPHVILMDINMPRLSGIEATRVVKNDHPEIKVIALTVHSDDDKVFEVIKSGVNGYILKDVSPDDLINTVKSVCAGETVIHPTITAKLLNEYNRMSCDNKSPNNNPDSHNEEDEHLTHREIEILKLIAQGVSNKDIAQTLFISEKTVKNHISNIFRKIHVCDRTQAAVYAIKYKIVRIE